MVPDPMGQYASSYLGMGNNPVNMTDPSGGWSYFNNRCECEWDTEWGSYIPMPYTEEGYMADSRSRGLSAAYANFSSLHGSMEALMRDIEIYANLRWRSELSAANRKFYNAAGAAGLDHLHYSSKHQGWGHWEDDFTMRTYEQGEVKVTVYDVTATFRQTRGSLGGVGRDQRQRDRKGRINLDPDLIGGLAVAGGMIGGLKQSYERGSHTVRKAQRVNGKVRSSAVLNRASRMHAAKMASGLKVIGRGVTGLSFAAAAYEFSNSDKSGADYARFAGSFIITGTAAIPFVGPVISIGLGAADAYGAFDHIYNYFE